MSHVYSEDVCDLDRATAQASGTPEIGKGPVFLRCCGVLLCLGNFTIQDFDIILHSFCADSSSPRIFAILVGHFTGENGSLRKTSAKLSEQIRRTKSNPGSQ